MISQPKLWFTLLLTVASFMLFAVATAISAVTASFVRVGGSPSGVHRHRLPIA